MSFFGLGGGLKVHIRLDGARGNGTALLDHLPSWKLRKNPFLSLRYPKGPSTAAGSGGAPDHSDDASTMSELTAPTVMTSDYSHSSSSSMKQPIVAYESSEDVAGVVSLNLAPGKKMDHLGIKIQFIGRIEMEQTVHEGRPHYDFISLSKELAPPGNIFRNIEIPFHFRNIEKEYESYRGRNVAVRYFVRVVVERKFLPPIQKEEDVIVQILQGEPPVNEAIKMEVGIEDCLHIEFEYEKRCYHLRDVIIGKVNFLLVRIKIKHMELAVIRRETTGEGVAAAAAAEFNSRATSTDTSHNTLTETQTLIKCEIMDGAPVKGEVIPVRLFLGGIPADLSPTYTAVNNRFSVRYFLNLVLVDQEDRRYFKQQEIVLWRKYLG